MKGLIEYFCARDDLSTPDPYDVWNTGLGFRVKRFYHRHPLAGLGSAGAGALLDLINDKRRWFYTPREYPIVRAMAALSLLNLYRHHHEERILECAESHLQWLLVNRCRGYFGYGWGLGFRHAVTADLVYDDNTPFSTMTPYPLEAFLAFTDVTGDERFRTAIEGILQFFDHDIQVMEEDAEGMATSYGPFRDRTVINAASYAMYSYALCLPYAPPERRPRVQERIRKLYLYIRRNQRADGSWLYSSDGPPFIDCFHSCIVLKNLIKCSQTVTLDGSANVIRAGYDYLKKAFFDERRFLFRRFSLRNKPGLVRFDLYDNSEALNLSLLLGDIRLSDDLLSSILRNFVSDLDIYSKIDVFGVRRTKNTLRWAVMPFLYAVSQLV